MKAYALTQRLNATGPTPAAGRGKGQRRRARRQALRLPGPLEQSPGRAFPGPTAPAEGESALRRAGPLRPRARSTRPARSSSRASGNEALGDRLDQLVRAPGRLGAHRGAGREIRLFDHRTRPGLRHGALREAAHGGRGGRTGRRCHGFWRGVALLRAAARLPHHGARH
ncbi:MAG: hypothetical protein WKG07_17650 [Hymenobacter sp.]